MYRPGAWILTQSQNWLVADMGRLLNIPVSQFPNMEIIIAFTLQGYIFSIWIKWVNTDKVHKIVS